MYNRRKIEMMKERYPAGTRICLDSMGNDPDLLSWLSIITGMSDYNWNDIKCVNYGIEYSGEFQLEDDLQIEFYIKKTVCILVIQLL